MCTKAESHQRTRSALTVDLCVKFANIALNWWMWPFWWCRFDYPVHVIVDGFGWHNCSYVDLYLVRWWWVNWTVYWDYRQTRYDWMNGGRCPGSLVIVRLHWVAGVVAVMVNCFVVTVLRFVAISDDLLRISHEPKRAFIEFPLNLWRHSSDGMMCWLWWHICHLMMWCNNATAMWVNSMDLLLLVRHYQINVNSYLCIQIL